MKNSPKSAIAKDVEDSCHLFKQLPKSTMYRVSALPTSHHSWNQALDVESHNRQDSEHSEIPKKGKQAAQGEQNCGLKLGIIWYSCSAKNVLRDGATRRHQTRICQSPSIPIGGHNLAPRGSIVCIRCLESWCLVTSCYIYCSFEKASEFTSKSFAPHVPRSGCQTVPSACFAPQLCQKAKHDLANQMDPNWKARNCYSTQDAPLSIQLFHIRGEIQVSGNPDSSQTSIEVSTMLIPKSSVFCSFFLQEVSRINAVVHTKADGKWTIPKKMVPCLKSHH